MSVLTLPDDLNNVTKEQSGPFQLSPRRRELSAEKDYLPSEGLVKAIKVALLLRKPLLVTGAPGTGKTDLGRYLAWKMRLPRYQFNAKSTSVAADLFYSYDALGRFQAKQLGEDTAARPFIHFEALGEAILRAAEPSAELAAVLPEYSAGERHQSVVIIDEIDKAPRDFPNDLLNEIEQRFFQVPALGNLVVRAEAKLEPILVITSNSEKNLPQAFLRRCVYFHIDPPKIDDLRRIAGDRIAEFKGGAALEDALRLFLHLRDGAGLGKPPATAELLDWLAAMSSQGVVVGEQLTGQQGIVGDTIPALIKQEADRKAAEAAIADQLKKA